MLEVLKDTRGVVQACTLEEMKDSFPKEYIEASQNAGKLKRLKWSVKYQRMRRRLYRSGSTALSFFVATGAIATGTALGIAGAIPPVGLAAILVGGLFFFIWWNRRSKKASKKRFREEGPVFETFEFVRED